MYGGIDARILFDIVSSQGVYHQLSLDVDTPIWVFVKPEFLTSVSKGYSTYSETGYQYGVMGTTDHPYFAETRNMLESKGYIDIQRGWINGDRVLKPFFFNNVLLVEGEKFSSAGAMYYSYHENYNDGEPIFDLKNYKKRC